LILLILSYSLLWMINLLKTRVPVMNKLSSFFNKYMIWNFALVFLNSQFVPVVLPCIINILNVKNSTRIEIVSAIITAILLTTVLIALIKFCHLIFSNTVALSSRFLKEGLKNSNSAIVRYWKLLWLLRWIVTLFILVVF
jgi:hypothetical protein